MFKFGKSRHIVPAWDKVSIHGSTKEFRKLYQIGRLSVNPNELKWQLYISKYPCMNTSDLSLIKILMCDVSPIREVIVSRSERKAGICCSCSCSSSTAPRLFSQCAHSITTSPSTIWQTTGFSYHGYGTTNESTVQRYMCELTSPALAHSLPRLWRETQVSSYLVKKKPKHFFENSYHYIHQLHIFIKILPLIPLHWKLFWQLNISDMVVYKKGKQLTDWVTRLQQNIQGGAHLFWENIWHKIYIYKHVIIIIK